MGLMVCLGQHDLNFAHVLEGQYEKVHFSLEFFKFITNLGIFKVGVLGVWVPQSSWAHHQPIHVFTQFIHV